MTNWANYGKWRHGEKRKELLNNPPPPPKDRIFRESSWLETLTFGLYKSKKNKVMNKEVKKCVLEILDVLYDKPGFDYWWHNLGEESEEEITAELEQIVKRRFKKIENEQFR